ncbi:hypothetical protein GCM10009838_50790 [Catenulispora subtropica]|uniref:Uncharacterized protein n=1 Tax=Catenulispora subtropica TaxID=450798 RepID=A0ABN2S9T2_9ACTN
MYHRLRRTARPVDADLSPDYASPQRGVCEPAEIDCHVSTSTAWFALRAAGGAGAGADEEQGEHGGGTALCEKSDLPIVPSGALERSERQQQRGTQQRSPLTRCDQVSPDRFRVSGQDTPDEHSDAA